MSSLVDKYSKTELESIVASSHSLREITLKVGYNTATGRNTYTVKKKLKEYGIELPKYIHPRNFQLNATDVFMKDSSVSQSTLRRWYRKLINDPYKCSICGMQPFWNGKELTLILDHINGNNKDNRVNNLRWVCPNCNQQLETTGYRNTFRRKLRKRNYCVLCGTEILVGSKMCRKCANRQRYSDMRNGIDIPSREILKDDIRSMSFVSVGKKYGVTDNAVKKWCDVYGLPRRTSEIRGYTDSEWIEL